MTGSDNVQDLYVLLIKIIIKIILNHTIRHRLDLLVCQCTSRLPTIVCLIIFSVVLYKNIIFGNFSVLFDIAPHFRPSSITKIVDPKSTFTITNAVAVMHWQDQST